MLNPLLIREAVSLGSCAVAQIFIANMRPIEPYARLAAEFLDGSKGGGVINLL